MKMEKRVRVDAGGAEGAVAPWVHGVGGEAAPNLSTTARASPKLPDKGPACTISGESESVQGFGPVT
jgi:hypothetical protein